MSRKKFIFLVGGLVAIAAVFVVLHHMSQTIALAQSYRAPTTKLGSQQRTIASRPPKGVRAVECLSHVGLVPVSAISDSGIANTVSEFPPWISEQLPGVAEGKAFVIHLQRVHDNFANSPVPVDVYVPDSGVGTAQVEPMNLQPIDATLYCHGFEIASDRKEHPSARSTESHDESQSGLQPPTESFVEPDAAEALTSPPSLPSEEPEQGRSADTRSDDLPDTTQPVIPKADGAHSESRHSNIEFVCDGEVSLVFRTSLIRAASLSYTDGRFRFVDAVVSTPFGELTAPTLSLAFPLDGLHIHRISSEADASPILDDNEFRPSPSSLPAPRIQFPPPISPS